MINETLPTRFAPAGRLPVESLAGFPESLSRLDSLKLLENMPVMVFGANPWRQIVYCNPFFAGVLPSGTKERVVGLRPGEALGCVNASVMEAGCGCSEYCRHCGAANAILKSLRGETDCRECHILARNGQGVHALDIQILARPLEFQGQAYSLNVALDVSHERRLFGLKRTFLHSMINAAGGLDTMFALLDTQQGDELLQHIPILRKNALSMLQEVLYQYDIMASEAGMLVVQKSLCDLPSYMSVLARQLQSLPEARGRDILAHGPASRVWTDSRLLRHVLRNLVMNALEASPVGSRIRIRWEAVADGVLIDVENPGSAPGEIATNFFKRYVSTKGEDRGLGLYASKIFTENHLGGSLSYIPRERTTVFRLFLPDSPESSGTKFRQAAPKRQSAASAEKSRPRT
jgi:hypothetical protein